MKKRSKVLVIGISAVAIGAGFFASWFANQQRYEAFHKDMSARYEKDFGRDKNLRGYRLDQALHQSTLNLDLTVCLNRFRSENHSFALALSACKQEAQ